jgi:hypothetical protein
MLRQEDDGFAKSTVFFASDWNFSVLSRRISTVNVTSAVPVRIAKKKKKKKKKNHSTNIPFDRSVVAQIGGKLTGESAR